MPLRNRVCASFARPCTRTVSGTTSVERELERRRLGQEAERVARLAAGDRRDEVVDEDAVRLGAEAHAPAPADVGGEPGAEVERHDEQLRLRLVDDLRPRARSARRRAAGRARRSRRSAGPSRCAARGSSASSTCSLISARVRSTFGWPISSWWRDPYSGWPSGASSPLCVFSRLTKSCTAAGTPSTTSRSTVRAGAVGHGRREVGVLPPAVRAGEEEREVAAHQLEAAVDLGGGAADGHVSSRP